MSELLANHGASPVITTGAVMFGRLEPMVIVWLPLNTVVSNVIVSRPVVPALHSPDDPPDGALVFAAMIASRSVQLWSLPLTTSAVLFTVIVAPGVTAAARRTPCADNCRRTNTAVRSAFISHLSSRRSAAGRRGSAGIRPNRSRPPSAQLSYQF